MAEIFELKKRADGGIREFRRLVQEAERLWPDVDMVASRSSFQGPEVDLEDALHRLDLAILDKMREKRKVGEG